MKPVNPGFGDTEVVGEESLEWCPIPATRVHGAGESFESMLVRWTFTPEERRRIAEGEDITITFPRKVSAHAVRLFDDNFWRRDE